MIATMLLATVLAAAPSAFWTKPPEEVVESELPLELPSLLVALADAARSSAASPAPTTPGIVSTPA